MQGLKHVKDWSEETVDEVLREGDRLYNDSVQILTESDKFENRMLTLGEVNNRHNLYDKRANFTIEECFITGVLNTKKDDEVSDLGKVSFVYQ